MPTSDLKKEDMSVPTTTQHDVLVERGDEVRRMYSGGASIADIAEHLGVRRNAVSAYLHSAGVADVARHKNALDASQRQHDVVAWISDNPGCSYKDIQEATGLSHSTIQKYLVGSPVRNLIVDRRDIPQKYSNGDIRSAMRAVWREMTTAEKADGLGAAQYDKQRGTGTPTSSGIVLRYGSWAEACKAAGVTHKARTRPGVREYDESELRDALVRFVLAVEKPTIREYERWSKTQPDVPSAAVIRLRLGKWSDVLASALEQVALGIYPL